MTIDDAIRSLNGYAEYGWPQGGFLSACLANDLMEAAGRADKTSREIIFQICDHIHSRLPRRCHGSYEIVASWIKAKNAERDLAEPVADTPLVEVHPEWAAALSDLGGEGGHA